MRYYGARHKKLHLGFLNLSSLFSALPQSLVVVLMNTLMVRVAHSTRCHATQLFLRQIQGMSNPSAQI